MSEDYFEFNRLTSLGGADELQLDRSVKLREAIKTSRDFNLLSVAAFIENDEVAAEVIYVEVVCDEVPPKNLIGINFLERLAIFVSRSHKYLVEVFPLRKSFPVTMHQNERIDGFSSSLCLYFEPVSSVARNWTAEKFLKRIQWWLEKTAKNELHASDQPLENLFFNTQYELVLPWNFDQLRAGQNSQFILTAEKQRFDKTETFFIEKANDKHLGKVAGYIEMDLPTVVHGNIERNPVTLGELNDSLAQKGVDLIKILKEKIGVQVPELGVEKQSDNNVTVLILHIPISSKSEAPPSSIQHKAFLLTEGILKLGESLNFLFLLKNKYVKFAEVLPSNTPTSWRTKVVHSMDIQYENDIEAFRKQSGTPDTDPKIALVGAGALGSAILELFARGGWGHWTIVDKDHVKPHNLSRHIAFSQHIGLSKADVVASIYNGILNGARDATAINADVSDIGTSDVRNSLESLDLVIDATTTLEYPRSASQLDQFPRHISVFITPNGKSAVLMAEDVERNTRLRTLEAQYYRALIQENWGVEHLEGNVSTFWSGASCRDISFVLSNIQVSGHAATLANKIQQVTLDNHAQTIVWNKHLNTGSVEVINLDTYSELVIDTGDLKILMDEGARNQLLELREKALPNETGGAILGYYDFNLKTLTIVLGLAAPSDSISTESSFSRGTNGLSASIEEAKRRTAGVVGYIGEWHSHPEGCSVLPSADDLKQLEYLRESMATDGLPALQVIVGDDKISIVLASINYPC